jgi:hypothetical protein
MYLGGVPPLGHEAPVDHSRRDFQDVLARARPGGLDVGSRRQPGEWPVRPGIATVLALMVDDDIRARPVAQELADRVVPDVPE